MNYPMMQQPQQWWQADVSGGGEQGNTNTPMQADDFGSMFASLTKDNPEPVIEKQEGVDAGATADPGGTGGGDGGAAPAVGATGPTGDTGAAPAGATGPDQADGGTDTGEGLPTPEQVAAEQAAAAEAARAATPVGATGATGAAVQDKPLGDVLREILAERQTAEQKAERERQAAAEREAATRQPAPITPNYTDEEKTLLDTYQKEFPEVAVAEELKRREEYRMFAASIFGHIDKIYGPQLKALAGFAQMQGATTHAQQLYAAIPDYTDVRQPVLDWIETQPENLKASFKQVATQGSVDDIKTMVDFWRTVTGKTAPAAGATGATGGAPPAGATGTASKPKQVIDALRAPTTKRTNVDTPTIAADDFGGAFKTFAGMEL